MVAQTFSIPLPFNAQMKYLAYILSFIVVFLSAEPCIDGLKDNYVQNTEISQTADHNNQQHDIDHCSPFCTCQCCQSHFFVSNITASNSAVELEINYIEFYPSFQSIALPDLLIPPRS